MGPIGRFMPLTQKQDKAHQYAEASALLKSKDLHHLIGVEKTPGQGVEVRGLLRVL